MVTVGRAPGWILVGLMLILATFAGVPRGEAAEVGEPAPDFKLASTRGVDIALAEFRGKKWVFLEFYGGDFHPS